MLQFRLMIVAGVLIAGCGANGEDSAPIARSGQEVLGANPDEEEAARVVPDDVQLIWDEADELLERTKRSLHDRALELAEVKREIDFYMDHGRDPNIDLEWFDDYEVSFDDAEKALLSARRALRAAVVTVDIEANRQLINAQIAYVRLAMALVNSADALAETTRNSRRIEIARLLENRNHRPL